jgi:hypothetical protein
MATIERVNTNITDEAGLSFALQFAFASRETEVGFSLSNYDDGTAAAEPMELKAGTAGVIRSVLYYIDNGNFPIDLTALSASGIYYVYIEDTGSSVIAYADTTAPTWDRGWFKGATSAKCFFQFLYTSGTGVISNRYDFLQYRTFLNQFDNWYTDNITDKAGTGPVTAPEGIKTDTITEETTDNGVIVDGVLLKDNDVEAEEVRTDSIIEKTADNGVTVEGVLIKDADVNADTMTTDDLTLNSTSNGILGSVTGFDLSSYLNVGTDLGSFALRIGQVVLIYCSAVGANNITMFTGIPAAWRPSANTKMVAQNENAGTLTAREAVVKTDGTISLNVAGAGAANVYFTGAYLL